MLLFVLALAAADPAPSTEEARFTACAALAQKEPEKAIADATSWRDAGGGLLARQCLGLAFVAADRWQPAALAFEQAARDAELARDGRAANLWVQSGNASLAADDAVRARNAFDRALGIGTLTGPLRGEVLVDRARAWVASDNLVMARADLDSALTLVPEDPMAWLLSAALARRQGQLERARLDIAEAAKRAPGELAVIAEQEAITAAASPQSKPQSQSQPEP